MEDKKEVCLIWGTTVTHKELLTEKMNFIVEGSLRAGGDYEITDQARRYVATLDQKDKAKLTTILIELRRAGDRAPLVDSDLVEKAKRADPLPVHVRAERLLRYLVSRAILVGQSFRNNIILEDLEALAWSESIRPDDILYFVNYLTDMKWLNPHRSGCFMVTVPGYQHVAEQATKKDLSQCFVAMWFDDSMKPAYEEGIEKAVEECGYEPKRIDQKQHLNKICDEAIAEIRRSRFVVADFTHGADGARGSVFYEAGFAHALGLPVIFSCQKDLAKSLHFDTRQYPHILWEKPEDLYAELRDKIGAIIGDHKSEPAHAMSE